jgi:hypothetical protein
MVIIKKYWLSILCAVIVLSSIWLGWLPVALFCGILGIWVGMVLFKSADLNISILLKLPFMVILICLAFGLLYMESFNLSFGDSIVLSFQSLLHVSIINIDDCIENFSFYKVLASFESLIGYLLIVSGISLMIKSNNK